MELIHINYEVTNNDNFETFLRHLKKLNKGKFAIFMDQLGIHRSNLMK